MKKIIVRRMVIDDVYRGFAKALSALVQVNQSPVELLRQFLARRKRGVFTYVAVENNRIIGTASIFIEPKFIHDGRPAGHIEDVAVHKKHQGKGIGRLLIDKILRFCNKKNCYKVILDCDGEVIEFYKKFGFIRNGTCMRLDNEL